MASQAQSTRRGALIVVEGLDRAGKSSQCEMLRDSLSQQGSPVKYIRFPGIWTRFYRHVYWSNGSKTGLRPSGN